MLPLLSIDIVRSRKFAVWDGSFVFQFNLVWLLRSALNWLKVVFEVVLLVL